MALTKVMPFPLFFAVLICAVCIVECNLELDKAGSHRNRELVFSIPLTQGVSIARDVLETIGNLI
ncbi:protein of unknown function [Tepidanaerobacter acetatoxydans Re1]|uniref:Uncharacterized protein n=1 Tax=Tepidanaerobacter acetatoxydans (strain DSM 21804 / JCM 16047 / Re1) TaxID=1209989 RepID=L0S382_TEPAE|nr:protein of unknown function [Tepidanaerobacter acetatoxydans Re1]